MGISGYVTRPAGTGLNVQCDPTFGHALTLADPHRSRRADEPGATEQGHTSSAGSTAAQPAISAAAPVATHPVDDNASAKVATRDEVCRRRNRLRRAWVRNQY